jgi:hypothetical protein
MSEEDKPISKVADRVLGQAEYVNSPEIEEQHG